MDDLSSNLYKTNPFEEYSQRINITPNKKEFNLRDLIRSRKFRVPLRKKSLKNVNSLDRYAGKPNLSFIDKKLDSIPKSAKLHCSRLFSQVKTQDSLSQELTSSQKYKTEG